MLCKLTGWFCTRLALLRRIEGVEAQLLLSREENDWLREQIDGYRNAFHSMETQHTAVGAQAKAYIRAIEQKDES